MEWTLFFDADCAFCSQSARLVARLDRRRRIGLAPLQGERSRRLGFSHHAEGEGGTMVLLRETDRAVFLRSNGLLELARALGGRWRVFQIFGLVPAGIRDLVYRWVARNRSHLAWAGGGCPLADPAVRERLPP